MTILVRIGGSASEPALAVRGSGSGPRRVGAPFLTGPVSQKAASHTNPTRERVLSVSTSLPAADGLARQRALRGSFPHVPCRRRRLPVVSKKPASHTNPTRKRRFEEALSNAAEPFAYASGQWQRAPTRRASKDSFCHESRRERLPHAGLGCEVIFETKPISGTKSLAVPRVSSNRQRGHRMPPGGDRCSSRRVCGAERLPRQGRVPRGRCRSDLVRETRSIS
jgi:hypothetical protein